MIDVSKTTMVSGVTQNNNESDGRTAADKRETTNDVRTQTVYEDVKTKELRSVCVWGGGLHAD